MNSKTNTTATDRVTCPDCGRWEYLSSGKSVRHSKRCCLPASEVAALGRPAPDAQRERVLRGEWTTAAEVTNEFGYGERAGRILLDTDY